MNVELTNKDLEQGSLEFEPNPRAGPESERVKGNPAQTSRSLRKPLTLNEWGLTNKDLEQHGSLEFEPNPRAGPSHCSRGSSESEGGRGNRAQTSRSLKKAPSSQ
ncbi:hypothetical protein TNCV_4359361 [Trichonephila clavipes]|uniref:Uncharacterized protein n=1 Tax=Trichonephila clavipes TaxID=2585209 RepID=A0A8X6WA56_TRICX|nr:hypothetical protein TNCV_4359361 [Trichonephila clavipes]